MNNAPISIKAGKTSRRPKSLLFSILSLFTLALLFVAPGFGQTMIWRYVATLPASIGKQYLGDEIKILPNKDRLRWEKLFKSDGSSAVALVQWNCPDKLRLTRQMTFYNSDQTVIGTKKTGYEWSAIIPGTIADTLYHRVCQPVPVIVGEITADRTLLKDYPDESARAKRTAARGERFEVVPESSQSGWYNIVDAETQEDYWVSGDAVLIIKDEMKDKAKNTSAQPRRSGKKAKKKN